MDAMQTTFASFTIARLTLVMQVCKLYDSLLPTVSGQKALDALLDLVATMFLSWQSTVALRSQSCSPLLCICVSCCSVLCVACKLLQGLPCLFR